MSGPRLVILAGEGESTRILYHALAAEFHVERVIIERPVPRLDFLRRRLKRHGLSTVLGQLLFIGILIPYLRLEARRRTAEIRRRHRLDDGPIDKARILRVVSANGPDCIAALQEIAPDLVVVNGTRILSRALLEAVPVPFLNLHAGVTPRYRGVHGGYWALAEGRTELCGVTLHLVDPGIDTGAVLDQRLITPDPTSDNFASYPLLQLAAGLPALMAALRGARAERRPLSDESRLYTHPTVIEYATARFRRGVR